MKDSAHYKGEYSGIIVTEMDLKLRVWGLVWVTNFLGTILKWGMLEGGSCLIFVANSYQFFFRFVLRLLQNMLWMFFFWFLFLIVFINGNITFFFMFWVAGLFLSSPFTGFKNFALPYYTWVPPTRDSLVQSEVKCYKIPENKGWSLWRNSAQIFW